MPARTTGWMLEEPDFSGLTVQANGKIVAAGDSGLVRFNSDGTYDDSFPIEDEPPSLGAVTVQDDGKLLAAGHTSHSYAEEKEDFLSPAMARRSPRRDVRGRRHGDDRLRGPRGSGQGAGRPARRQDRRRRVFGGARLRRCPLNGLRARPLQARRHARLGVLRRRNADHQLRGRRRRLRRRSPAGRQDPRCRLFVGDFALARYEPDGRLDHTFSATGRSPCASAAGRRLGLTRSSFGETARSSRRGESPASSRWSASIRTARWIPPSDTTGS